MTQRSVPVPLIGSAVVTVALFLAQVYARETQPPGSSPRLALTVALIAAFSVTIWVHVRLSASLDEFNRQVQYVALAVAFPISLVAAFAIGYLAGEGLMSRFDPRDLPLVMILAYFISFAVAWRRYQ
jgi:uncharacterized membrane protein (DUF4010 family)